MNRALAHSPRFIVALSLLAVLHGCAVNPVTGKRELALLSEADEIELGRQNDVAIVEELGLYDHPEMARWVDQIGQRMAAASERPHLPWTFRVVDDPIVNAFALPGGFIYLTRGILGFMNTEAEVVGVLGHEIGHVTARHGVQQYTKASLAGFGLGLGSVLSSEVRAVGGVLETGLGLLFLKFSRDDETQADDLGVRYAAAAGYDPRELAGFFRTIERIGESTDGNEVPNWLSTHPDPPDRVERVLQASEALKGGALAVAREPHLRRLDGMVFGDAPREGVVIEGTFKHPDLLFQMEFPPDWPLRNGKQAVIASAPDGNAALVLTVQQVEGSVDLRRSAEREVASNDGSRVNGHALRVNGLEAYRVQYMTTTEGLGELEISQLFVAHRGSVFDLMGLAPRGRFSRVDDDIFRAQRSFRQLDEREAGRFQPHRIELRQIAGATPLAALLDPRQHAVDLETLALLNGRQSADTVPAGELVKLVRAGY